MDIYSIIEISVIFFIVLTVHISWAKYRIKQWAKNNNYTIIRCNLCLINIGPFSYFGTSGGQSVFKIEIISHEGISKKGHVRIGGFFFGLIRNRIEVKWDNTDFII